MTRSRAVAAGAIACLALIAPPVAAGPASAAVGPNGRIAYVAEGQSTIPFGPPTQTDIWVMNADGTGATNLTDTSDLDEFDPVWSPDGTRIAYISDSFVRNLSVMNADGTGATSVAAGALSPSWSPDGTSVAVLKERPEASPALVIIDLATGAETLVTDQATMEPVWSPDGAKFAFVGLREEEYPDPVTGEPQLGTQHEIVVVNADGTGEVVVSAGDPGSDRATYLEEDRSPAWSPDGTKIVFGSQAQNPSCCGAWQVWAVNADGSGATNLTADESAQDQFPSWSPDGTTILFSRAGQVGYDLFTMPAPTSLPISPSGARSAARLTEAVALAGPTGLATALTSHGNASDASWGVATAAPPTATLTVWRRGKGTVASSPAGISCGPDCTEAYPVGQGVTLTAKAKPGWRFAKWQGACAGQSRVCTLTMTADRTTGATFVRR